MELKIKINEVEKKIIFEAKNQEILSISLGSKAEQPLDQLHDLIIENIDKISIKKDYEEKDKKSTVEVVANTIYNLLEKEKEEIKNSISKLKNESNV